jgi:hypothetical protein
MRVVYHPILANIDGTLLMRGDSFLASFIVDPMRFSAEGMRETVEHVGRDTIKTAFGEVFQNHMDLADRIISHAFKTEEGNLFYQDAKQKHGKPDFDATIDAYTQKQLALFAEHPDALLTSLTEQREKIRVSDELKQKAIMIAGRTSPQMLQISDSGYDTDEDFAARSKATSGLINSVIRDHFSKPLADAIKNQDVTFAVFPAAMGQTDTMSYPQKMIAVSEASMTTPEVLANMVKEGALHYMDAELGFSKCAEFRRAAEPVLNDFGSVMAISAERKKSMSGLDKDTSHFTREQQYGELLISYFHIRDHLREEAGGGGFAQSRGGRSAKPDEAVIEQKMTELFGAQIHELCKQFEAQLGSHGQGRRSSRGPR